MKNEMVRHHFIIIESTKTHTSYMLEGEMINHIEYI